VIDKYIETAEGLPRIAEEAKHDRKLAICGAGPSLAKHLDTLKNWDGDIWAINSAPAYLATHGIHSTLFTVDPDVPEVLNLKGVTDALLWVGCDPRLKERFVNVRLFDMLGDGPTSICRAPFIATRLGYQDITLFGAEGSFGFKTMHVDVEEEDEYPFVACVHCDGDEFLTTIPLMSQTEYLAHYIRTNQGSMREESGGLLRALVKTDAWQMVAMTQALVDHFMGANDFGEMKLESKPFKLREGAHA
jgi:hypothetical protein